jgi:hypothetical protein
LIRCCCWSWSSYLELENKHDLPTRTTETTRQECQCSSWRCHTRYHLSQWGSLSLVILTLGLCILLRMYQSNTFCRPPFATIFVV